VLEITSTGNIMSWKVPSNNTRKILPSLCCAMDITWAKTLDHVFAVCYTNNSLADKLERMWVVWQKPWLELKELAIATKALSLLYCYFFLWEFLSRKLFFLEFFVIMFTKWKFKIFWKKVILKKIGKRNPGQIQRQTLKWN